MGIFSLREGKYFFARVGKYFFSCSINVSVFFVNFRMKWLYFLLLVPLSLSGQSIDSLQFYRVEADFSHHSFTRILEDKYGFMWFATRYGLNRFDGEKVVSFYNESAANGSLSNSFVSDMTLDNEGNIWLGTYGGGVNLYNEQLSVVQQKVISEEISSALANKLVTGVLNDKKGDLWISTEKSGLFSVDPTKGTIKQFSHYADDPGSLSDNNLLGMAEDGQGNIWIGSWGKGLNLFLRQSQRFIRFTTASHPAIPHDIVRCMSPSSRGHLWLGFQEGLRKVRYHQGEYHFEKAPSSSAELSDLLDKITVLSVLEDRQSRLWVGTENNGLIVVNLKNGAFKQYWRNPYSAQAIGSNSIWSLYEDSFGTVWIGTYGQGVFKVDPYEKRFEHIHQTQNPENALSHNLISSFAEDEEGNLYIGTDGGGLNLLQKDGIYRHFTPENSLLRSGAIMSLLYDRKGNLWIGTWEGGLSVKKKGSETFYNFPYKSRGKGTSGKFIFDLLEDSKGRLWVSSFRSGLDVYIPEKDTFYHFSIEETKHRITANTIQSIAEDGEGNIWLGTEGSGLDKLVLGDQLETKEIINYSTQAAENLKINHNYVSCIFLDRYKKLWIGTHGGGLNWYDTADKKFHSLTKKDGLPSNLIYAIEEDQQGELWISTNKGLCRYNPQSQTVETFDTSDGLQSMEFFSRASYATKKGALLFGGTNGFNRFLPSNIHPIPQYGKVYITDFNFTGTEKPAEEKLFNQKHLLNQQDIALDYHQNDFSISFSYLNFTQASKNQYQYKLEGYDNGWQSVGSRNTAFYTNVPAGDYTFRVRAANGDQEWSKQQAKLGLMVRSPWYASLWAYAIYISIFTGVLIWRRNTIIHREKLKNNLRLEHLELKKLKELDEIKSRFFTNISHEFRTPLTLILSPLKSIYYDERWQDQRYRVKSMIHQAERLLGLINQILDLSKLESGSARLEAQKLDLVAFLKPLVYSFTSYADKQYIKYKVSLPPQPLQAYVDPDKMGKIVTNLLSNAFKFTSEFGEVSFSLETGKNEIVIKVSDNGEGIAQEELAHIFTRYYQGKKNSSRNNLGTGIGLALSKELIELHKGRIEVETHKDSGTSFLVHLPLGNSHLNQHELIEKPEGDLATSPELPSPSFAEKVEKQTKKEIKREEQKQTILIAEDNEDIREYLKENLSTEFNILEAADGLVAYDLIQDQKPDLVITDVLMPKLDGLSLCRKLKENEALSHIPTIMLTAKASSESTEMGYSLGADYYITKPFNPNHLRLQIQNILKARKNFRTQILHGNHLNLNPKNIEVPDADEKFIKQVIGIIEAHIAEVNFNINDLCKEIGISRMQLYRKLKASISMSANELIRHVRLQRAAQLIKKEQLSIAEITYMVGFTDLQYFRSCFKKQFGVNPSEYQHLKNS